ncbi:hypothetical protein ONZ45_g19590 [Pleurotus djamor]|nr:hypothetical protein ONZ45_g19590 [Pleurotus djamor]
MLANWFWLPSELLRVQLETAEIGLHKAEDSVKEWERKYNMEKKRRYRTMVKNAQLETDLRALEETNRTQMSILHQKDMQLRDAKAEIEVLKELIFSDSKKLFKCRKDISSLRRGLKRARAAEKQLKAKLKLTKCPAIFKLTRKGAFSPQHQENLF